MTVLPLLLVGLVLLVKSADWLVVGASALAQRLHMSSLVVGLTIVAFGTSAPEFVVTFFSAWQGHTELAVANIIGSVVTNTLLGLGIAAVVYPLRVNVSTVWREIPISIIAAALVVLLAINTHFGFGISRVDGAMLVGCFAAFMIYTFRQTSGNALSTNQGPPVSTAHVYKSGFITLLGLAGLAIGGDMIVANGTELAKWLGFTDSFIALVIIGPGTSLPEIAATAIAARKREADIAVGGIVGSNIFNLFWIIGITAVVSGLPVDSTMIIDLLMVIIVSVLLLIAMFIGKKHRLEQWQGGVFIAIYCAYIIFLFLRG